MDLSSILNHKDKTEKDSAFAKKEDDNNSPPESPSRKGYESSDLLSSSVSSCSMNDEDSSPNPSPISSTSTEGSVDMVKESDKTDSTQPQQFLNYNNGSKSVGYYSTPSSPINATSEVSSITSQGVVLESCRQVINGLSQPQLTYSNSTASSDGRANYSSYSQQQPLTINPNNSGSSYPLRTLPSLMVPSTSNKPYIPYHVSGPSGDRMSITQQQPPPPPPPPQFPLHYHHFSPQVPLGPVRQLGNHYNMSRNSFAADGSKPNSRSKQFSCSTCVKRFARKSDLVRHGK